MHVALAQEGDIDAWLVLASGVEMFFGPLVDNPCFLANLRKNIARGTALCIRGGDGQPGSPLAGGLMFAPHPPKYELSWLAVDERWRRRGVARALVNQLFRLVVRPANIVLLTDAEIEGRECAARAFYQRLGFKPCEPGPINPNGVKTQVFRLRLDLPPTVRAVMRRPDERFLLVQHHYRNPENHGKWSIPGGWIDTTDYDHLSTLRREIREEFGVEIDVVCPLGSFTRKTQDHHVYLAEPHSFDFTVDYTEIAGYEWFSVDEVRDLAANGTLLAGFIREAVEAAAQPCAGGV